MTTKGVKFDSQKPDMSLLSPFALEEIAKVMTSGKTKYGANNWRGGLEFSRLIAAVMRHLNAYQKGETIDPETSLSHLAHASCGLMMLIEFEKTRPELNDLYFCQQGIAQKNQEQLSLFEHMQPVSTKEVYGKETGTFGCPVERLYNEHYEAEQAFQREIRGDFIFERE